MRVLAATLAFTVFAQSTLALAGDSPVTETNPGYCLWSAEPELDVLADVVDDAKCEADEDVKIDYRLAMAVMRQAKVDAQSGTVIGEEEKQVFLWFPNPFITDGGTKQVFALNQYKPYRAFKAEREKWSETVGVVSGFAGLHSANAHAQFFIVAPRWTSDLFGAAIATTIDVAGGLVWDANMVALAPATGGATAAGTVGVFAEGLFDVPVRLGHGGSEVVDGLYSGDYVRAGYGGAEICGSVGIVFAALVPVAKGGGSLAARTRTSVAAKQPLSPAGKSPGTKTAGTKSAYEIAKDGGKHTGFLKNYEGKNPSEIQKGIVSIEKQIALHKEKIANPETHIPEWNTLDQRQRMALVEKKWPSDIARQQEQLEILKGILEGKQ